MNHMTLVFIHIHTTGLAAVLGSGSGEEIKVADYTCLLC